MKIRSLGLVAWTAMLAACGTESPQSPTTQPSPTTLEILSRTEWHGTSGEYFTEPFVVRVSRRGEGVPAISVGWSVTADSGEFASAQGRILNPQVTWTDSAGIARVFFRPLNSGTMTVSATVEGLPGSPARFLVTTTVRPVMVINFGPIFDCYFTPYSNDPSVFNDPQEPIPLGTTVEFVYAPWLPGVCNAQVVSVSVPPGGTPIDSGLIPAGGRFTFTFNAVGEWTYEDKLNGGRGKLRVQ
jgi:hypothetical protein